MEAFAQLLTDLGVENAIEMMQKPEEINVAELGNVIRTNLKAQHTNDPEFTGSYIEQGRQTTLSEFYAITAQVYGIDLAEIQNKPVNDVLNIAKAKAQANISKTNKAFEEENTAFRAKISEYENVMIPAIKQQKEQAISAIQNEYTVKAMLDQFQLSVERDVAEAYVMKHLFDPRQYKITKDEVTEKLLVTDPNGKPIRKSPAGDALDLKGVIGLILEKGKSLQMQPSKNNPSGSGGTFVNPAPTVPQNNNIAISHKALAHQAMLAQQVKN